MSVKLVSIPQVDISLLPLSLEEANGINNGGYTIPQFTGGVLPRAAPSYSPIDLLVAGLEATRRDIIITSLVAFFDNNREGSTSENDVYINLVYSDVHYIVYTISHLRWEVKYDINLLKLMKRNAPLTFKWS